MKYVQYQVQGAGSYKAGPYEDHEAQSQLDDIAGYAGVFNAHLIETSNNAQQPSTIRLGE